VLSSDQRVTGAKIITQPVRETTHKRLSNGQERKLIAIPGSWRRKAERTANLVESFFHAFRGFWFAFRSERNLRIHVVMAIIVAGVAACLRVDAAGWAMLTLAVGIVITAELINTALERLVDIATNNEFHRVARDAKDTAAAAVLVTAIMAAAIGGFVFIPRIFALLKH
jgi:diacylglycerol kinase